jgi:twinkle protein
MIRIDPVDFTSIKVQEILAEAEACDILWLGEDEEQRQRILARASKPRAMDGFTLPWSKTHDKVRIRSSELSLPHGR